MKHLRPGFPFSHTGWCVALCLTVFFLVAPSHAEPYFEWADALVAGPTAKPTMLVRSADGKTVYLAGDADLAVGRDGALWVLREQDGQWREAQTLDQVANDDFAGEVHGTLSLDGRFLYVATDTTLLVFAVATDGTLTLVERHLGLFLDSLAVLQGNDPTWLYVGFPNGILSIRANVTTGRLSDPETLQDTFFADFARSRDGQYLIAVGEPAVRLYSLRNGVPNRTASLDNFVLETNTMTAGMLVTTTRDSSEFYVYGRDAQPAPDTLFVGVLRIVAQDQLAVVGEDDLSLSFDRSLSTFALSSDDDWLLAGFENGNSGSSSLRAFALLPTGAMGGESQDWRLREGDLIGPQVMLAAGGSAFWVAGFGGTPLQQVNVTEIGGELEGQEIVPTMTEPISLTVAGESFYVGSAHTMKITEGLRQGLGLALGDRLIEGGFAAPISDLVFSSEGGWLAAGSTSPDSSLLMLYSADNSVRSGSLFKARFPALVVSPDQRFVYVEPENGWQILTDRLEPIGTLTTAPTETVIQAAHLRISPDGGHFFQVIDLPDAPSSTRYFRRNTETGVLTEDPAGAALAFFGNAVDLAFSPDGRHAYVLRALPGVEDQVFYSLDAFAFDAEDGSFTTIGQFSDLAFVDHPSQPIGELVLDPTGRFLFFASRKLGQIAVYEREPDTGALALREYLPLPAGGNESTNDLSLAAGPSGELWVADQNRGRVDLFRRNCVATSSRNLCLGEGRFLAEIDWHTLVGEVGAARRVADTPSSDSGLFYFFSPDNWEVLVKVLDGCGLNERFWVFSAGTTNVEYQMRVVDTWTARASTYRQEQGILIPAITDTDALDVCLPSAASDELGSATQPVLGWPADGPAAAASGEETLHLGSFDVRVSWETPAGERGVGQVVPFQSADSGLFTFFSPNNWEALVKVLNGCAINGYHWVFAAAPTNVGFTLSVTETTTQETKSWTNAPGQPAPSIVDTLAFPCP